MFFKTCTISYAHSHHFTLKLVQSKHNNAVSEPRKAIKLTLPWARQTVNLKTDGKVPLLQKKLVERVKEAHTN